MAAEIPQPDRDIFPEELARYLGNTVELVATVSVNASRLVLSPHIWRQRVYDLIRDIIDPEPLTWMDDDDTTFIPDLCHRSLDEVRFRFEQYVISTSIWMHA